MRARIAKHQQDRPAGFATVEAPLRLAETLRQQAAPGRLLLVDCLTLWLTNLMLSGDEPPPETGELVLPPRFERERAAVLDLLSVGLPGELILVSNEVGMGIVPFGAVSRCFADEAGRLNQAVAAICDRAVFVAAGLPLVLKGAPC